MASHPRTNGLLITFGMIGLLVFFIVGFIVPAFSDEARLTDESFQTTISKEKAAEAALQFAEKSKLVPGKSAHPFVMFQSETLLSGYLQKNKLLQDYKNTYLKTYPIDYFQVELTYPGSPDRYVIDIDMHSAQVVGWKKLNHPVRNDVEKSSPPTESELEAARQFIALQGYDPSALQWLRHDSKDGTLHFLYDRVRIGDAPLTLKVLALDGRIHSYQAEFVIPDEYLAWEKKQESSRMQMSMIALLTQFLLAIGAVVMAVLYRGTIPFRRGLLLTFAYIITATINNINMYPALKVVGIELGSGGAEALLSIIINQVYTFIVGIVLYLSLISGQAAWLKSGRDLWPRWAERDYGQHVLSAMGKGYLICFIMLGVQQVLFLAGAEFLDVWGTNDPEFSTYNILIPALFPLLAWAAAIMEEAIYRMFAIILFKKIFRSTLVAILLSSMIWAIGHAAYPWYPAYTRFIEATILGFFFSWAYLRHGFITAVFAHAAFDSILMGLSILLIGGMFNGIMGIFYLGFPALVAWIIFAVHRTFAKRRPRPGSPPRPANA